MRRILFPVLLLALVGSLSPGRASAQLVLLDQGVFEVVVDGREAGTETFRIHRLGTGDETRVIAAGQVRTTLNGGSSTMDIVMELTGSGWMPSAYQNKVGGDEAQQIGFELRGTRFESRVTSVAGEQVKEYRALPGTRILERGVAHHFHFFTPGADSGPARVPVIVPRDRLQMDAEVIPAEMGEVRIGGRAVPARGYRMRVGSLRWEIWYDAEDRVLQVREDSTGYFATRTARPGT